MQLPLDELNRRLDSLDEVISLMAKDQTDRDYLWSVVSSAADALQSLAGPHHDYVAARLLAIIVSHGLRAGSASDDRPT